MIFLKKDISVGNQDVFFLQIQKKEYLFRLKKSFLQLIFTLKNQERMIDNFEDVPFFLAFN